MALLDSRQINAQLRTNVAAAVAKVFPIVEGTTEISVSNVTVDTAFDSTALQTHQEARLQGKDRTVPVLADMELKRDGKIVQSRKQAKLGDLPLLSGFGSFVVGGNDYITHFAQLRLKPGLYTREATDGSFETTIHVAGSRITIWMEPSKGLFKMGVGTTNVNLLPILLSLGVTKDQVITAWGNDSRARDLYARNESKGTEADISKLYEVVARLKVKKEHLRAGIVKRDEDAVNADLSVKIQTIKAWLESKALDAYVTKKTTGQALTHAGQDALVIASKRVLEVQREGAAKADDRDAPEFKSAHDVTDLMPERIGRLAKMWAYEVRSKIKRKPEATLTQLTGPNFINDGTIGYFLGSPGLPPGLANTAELPNPLAILANRDKMTITGPGGIQDAHSVTNEARLFRMGATGFVDPVQTVEGSGVGVTTHAAMYTGKVGNSLATPMFTVENGVLSDAQKMVTAEEANEAVVGLPESWDFSTHKPKDGKVRAIKNHQIFDTDATDVKYVIPSGFSMFGATSNAASFLAHTHANRGMMVGKHLTQTLPLVHREKPLAVSKNDFGEDYGASLGRQFAILADTAGTVTKMEPGAIWVGDKKYEYFDRYPMQAKVTLHHEPRVKVGDSVQVGDVLADSNYTKDGVLAPGVNLRSAYTPWRNATNFEDAIVVSDSAAKLLTSEHTHTMSLWPLDNDTIVGTKEYVAQYPTKLDRTKAGKLGADGIILEGQTVVMGDTLIAAIRKNTVDSQNRTAENYASIHKKLQRPYRDAAVVWDLPFSGEVYRVVKLKDRVNVYVETKEPLQVGDKLSNGAAAKGTISEIIPDDKMPQDEQGRPIQIILNPHGVAGRINPGQTIEQAAGKLVRDGGKTYEYSHFDGRDHASEVAAALKDAGLKHEEILYDPITGKHTELPVAVGYNYMFKLDHSVRKKFSARSRAGYTQDEMPNKGSGKSAQSFDGLTTAALLGHNAHALLSESFGIRGTKNDDFWEAFQAGELPPPPKVPYAFHKFEALLNAAGIHTSKDNRWMHFAPLTSKQVLERSNGEITDSRMIRAKNLSEHEDGLFDVKKTGGLNGCFHPTTKILTDAGELSIGDIVNGRLSVRVLTYDFKVGAFVYRPVTNWWKTPGCKFVRATTSATTARLPSTVGQKSSKSVLWVTEDHKILRADGVKLPLNQMTQILALEDVPSPAQQAIIMGALLGDSWFDCGHIGFGHGDAQVPYLTAKCAALGGLMARRVSNTVSTKSIGGRSFTSSITSARTYSLPWISELSAQWVRAGRKEPVLSSLPRGENALLAMAVWYMDDGCCRRGAGKNTEAVTFCTNGFSFESAEMLCGWLAESGFAFSVVAQKGSVCGEPQPTLQAYGSAASFFLSRIAPYVEPSMAYKLGTPTRAHKCLTCDAKLEHIWKFCQSCESLDIQSIPGKLPKHYRTRYGSSEAARAAALCPAEGLSRTPASDTMDARSAVCGTRWTAMTAQTASDKRLVPASVTLEHNPIASYATDTVGYDLEVEGTHSYFANGYLVSNSNWTHLNLAEKMPHPLHEKVIRDVAEIKGADYLGLVAHTRHFDPKTNKFVDEPSERTLTGTKAFEHLLTFDQDAKLADFKRRAKTAVGSDRNKMLRAARYIEGLKSTGLDAKDAYLTDVLPVLPPKYRPLIEQQSGGLRVADANVLYRDVLLTNRGLTDAKAAGLPESELAGARIAAYDSVAGLVGVGAPLSKRRDNQELVGFVQAIKGKSAKEGLFQQTVSRRRNDYSARSTIEPGADLGPDEVSLPEDMAWEIYKAVGIRRLSQAGINPADALEAWEKRTMVARDALLAELADRPVVINRSPSLHKGSVLAQWARMHDGKAIKINPMILGPTGADFDGDTMSATVPITDAAKIEAIGLLPSKNLFYDRDRSIAFGLEKDIVTGLFMLTRQGSPTDKSYETAGDAIKAYENNKDSLKMSSMVTVPGYKNKPTIGQLIFEDIVPPRFRTGITYPLDGKKLEGLLRTIAESSPGDYNRLVRALSTAGFEASARSGGVTGTVGELVVNRTQITKLLDTLEGKIRGANSPADAKAIAKKYFLNETKPALEKVVGAHLSEVGLGGDVFFKAKPSAKLGFDSFMQMLASPTLVTDVKGEVIPSVIRSSYGGGMRAGDYLMTTPGARAGMVAKSLSTALPGYLSKEIIANVANVRISEIDCGTHHGITVQLSSHDADILDRHLVEDVGGFKRNDILTPRIVASLRAAHFTSVSVRSPMTCESLKPPCQMCAPVHPDGRVFEVGDNIGYDFGQSVGERSTQSVLKAFHSGGTVGSGEGLNRGFARLTELLRAPETAKDQGTLAEVSGSVSSIMAAPQGGHDITIAGVKHYVGAGREIKVKLGQHVEPGDALSDGNYRPQDLARLKGTLHTQQYLVNEMRDAFSAAGAVMRKPVLEVVAASVGRFVEITDDGGAPGVTAGEIMHENEAAALKKTHPGMTWVGTMPGLSQLPAARSKDPLERLNFHHLEDTLRQIPAMGGRSDLHGEDSPIPGLAYGALFRADSGFVKNPPGSHP